MNTYITFACLLVVVATGHGYAIGGYGLGGLGGYGGWGGVSIIKAAPIPIINSVAVAPVVKSPILQTVPVSTVGWGLNGGLGWGLGGGYGGLGLGGGYGGWGLGGWGKGKYL